MKKKSIFILSIILCLSLVIPTFAMEFDNVFYKNINSYETFDEFKMTDEEYKIYKKAVEQYDAVVFYDKLMSAFIDQYGEEGGSLAHYPDNYAGAYINDDGKLVIQIKKDNDLKLLNNDILNDYDIVDLDEIKKIEEFVYYSEVNDKSNLYKIDKRFKNKQKIYDGEIIGSIINAHFR